MRKLLFTSMFAIVLTPFLGFSQTNVITTIAGMPNSPGYSGDGGPAVIANLFEPSDVALDAWGNLYIADFINNVIRKVDTNGNISTFAGTGFGAGDVTGADGGYTGDNGPATSAELDGPFALAIDTVGNVFLADGYNHVVRKVDINTGIITTVAGIGAVGHGGDGGPATAASFDNPVGLAFDKAGNLYIADDHNRVIRKINTHDTITTFAGNHTLGYSGDGGPATAAALGEPIGVAVDGNGNVYIADTSNVIRKVDTAGVITTFAGTGSPAYTGDGGPATAATLNSPERVYVDDSNNVYISDLMNNVVRKVNTSGTISTIAGDGTQGYFGDDSIPTLAELYYPEGVTINKLGYIYIADRGNDIIRFISPPDTTNSERVATITSVSGSLSAYPNPSSGGPVTATLFMTTSCPVTMTLTNVLGQTVTIVKGYSNKPIAFSSDQPGGIYFLSAVTTTGSWNKKIIIAR